MLGDSPLEAYLREPRTEPQPGGLCTPSYARLYAQSCAVPMASLLVPAVIPASVDSRYRNCSNSVRVTKVGFVSGTSTVLRHQDPTHAGSLVLASENSAHTNVGEHHFYELRCQVQEGGPGLPRGPTPHETLRVVLAHGSRCPRSFRPLTLILPSGS